MDYCVILQIQNGKPWPQFYPGSLENLLQKTRPIPYIPEPFQPYCFIFYISLHVHVCQTCLQINMHEGD